MNGEILGEIIKDVKRIMVTPIEGLNNKERKLLKSIMEYKGSPLFIFNKD